MRTNAASHLFLYAIGCNTIAINGASLDVQLFAKCKLTDCMRPNGRSAISLYLFTIWSRQHKPVIHKTHCLSLLFHAVNYNFENNFHENHAKSETKINKQTNEQTQRVTKTFLLFVVIFIWMACLFILSASPCVQYMKLTRQKISSWLSFLLIHWNPYLHVFKCAKIASHSITFACVLFARQANSLIRKHTEADRNRPDLGHSGKMYDPFKRLSVFEYLIQSSKLPIVTWSLSHLFIIAC